MDTITLLRSIRKLARALDMHSSRINRDSGLTLPQLLVLTCVQDLRNGTVRAIAEAAFLSPPTVVGILDKLEAKGLIERARSATDRRLVQSRLTGEGEALLKQAPSLVGDGLEQKLLRLPEQTRHTLLDALQTVADMAVSQETPETVAQN